MKKHLYLLTNLVLSLVIATALVACDKDLDVSNLDPFRFDDGNSSTIKAQVYKGSKYNSKISTVKAVSNMSSTRSVQVMSELRAAPTGEAVANSDWSSGNFTLTLPTTIDASKLRNSMEVFSSFHYQFESTYTFLGTEAAPKSYLISIAAYDKAGNFFDDLVLYDSKAKDDVYVYFLYVENDLVLYYSSIYGPSGQPLKTYKKGWNTIYIAEVEGDFFNYKPTSNLYWVLSRDIPNSSSGSIAW